MVSKGDGPRIFVRGDKYLREIDPGSSSGVTKTLGLKNQRGDQRASKACLRLRSACSRPIPAATTSAMPPQAKVLGTSPHIQ